MVVDSPKKNISIGLERGAPRGAPENFETAQPKKRKYPGFRKNAYDYLTEFSSNTGIHGFQYMGDRELSIVEKCYWVILFAISLSFCIFLVMQAWMKWDESPVLVSFAPSPTPIRKIPFPAITICPETKARQTVYNYTYYFYEATEEIKQKLKNPMAQSKLTAEEWQRFSDTSLVCDFWREIGNKTTNNETIEHLIKIAPTLKREELFLECMWPMYNQVLCRYLFSPILTEYGMCFTFNMLHRSELFTNAVYQHGNFKGHDKGSEGWSLENGYVSKTAGMDIYPKRALSAGEESGLFLMLLDHEADLDYICRRGEQGFKVLLHHPADVPRLGTEYFRAGLNQEVVVGIKADVRSTSAGLKNYDPHVRKCYFSDERQLLFYKIYTQQNCRDECLANYTLIKCGCAAFYMPREASTKICARGSSTCLDDVKQELLERESYEMHNLEDSEDDIPQCDCLPGCSSIKYNADMTQTDSDWAKVLEARKLLNSYQLQYKRTSLTFFFKDVYATTYERSELYGRTDFVANCGGILGLFTGFSFLSIVEIVYFLSLRVICNVKKNGIHFWSGSKTLLNDDAYFPK